MKEKKEFRTLSVSTETLKFLENIKNAKSFPSYDELVYNCVKCCEYFTRPQILRLAEIDETKLEIAPNEQEMYRKLKKPKEKKEPEPRFGLGAGE